MRRELVSTIEKDSLPYACKAQIYVHRVHVWKFVPAERISKTIRGHHVYDHLGV